MVKLNSKDAAKEFAVMIQKLVEDGNVISLSVTINAKSSDELMQLAKDAGIDDVTVINTTVG